jgi:magnesium chelatase family protein
MLRIIGYYTGIQIQAWRENKMLAIVHSCAVIGLNGEIIEVEVDTRQGLPGITIVGLPDAAVQESKERVQSAINNAGFAFPRKRITVNLAPASIRKAGPVYDLPIALGVLIAGGLIPPEKLTGSIVIGELSLDGRVRHVSGVLSMAFMAQKAGYKKIFLPAIDAPEAACIPDLDVFAIDNLSKLIGYLTGNSDIAPQEYMPESLSKTTSMDGLTDFAEIKGQEHIKRALEVAAAGGHNALLLGSPGVGKSMMAKALPGILPPLTIEESLEITKIYSVADMLPSGSHLMHTRPFRSPHHTISNAGLVGGGNWPRPGEISLAHRGVLFLDEMPEFGQRVLEVIRQPLEDKQVTISRAQGSLTFPASFQLIAAMNPCQCGYFGDDLKECTCAHSSVLRYQKRISGPLLDRIDIHLHVPRVDYKKLGDARLGESSALIQKRILDSSAKCNK